MKKIFLLFAILIIASALGTIIANDPGYVLLSYANWSLETNILVGIIFIFLLVFCFIVVKNFLLIPSKFRIWQKSKLVIKKNKLLHDGFLALANGQFKEAINLLKPIDNEDNLFNYLGAAIAANEEENFSLRNEYLWRALRHNPKDEFTINLISARLQLKATQIRQGLANLEKLHMQNPKHDYILKLIKTIYWQQQDFNGFQKIMAKLKSRSLINKEEEKFINEGILIKEFTALCQIETATEEIIKFWQKKLNKDLQNKPEIVSLLFISCKQKEPLFLEKTLRKLLEQNWQNMLLQLYLKIENVDAHMKLKFLENKLEHYPQNIELLLAVAEVCMQMQFWGKAKKYLDIAINIAPCARGYWLLAKLTEQTSDQDIASQYYRESARIFMEQK